MDEFCQQCLILLTPTTVATAPSIDNPLPKLGHTAQTGKVDRLSSAEQKQLIYDQWLTAFIYTPFTQQANLFGRPALSVPTYVSKEGLPLGIQFNSALNENRTLLQSGTLFENNHRISQSHVEEPDKGEEPDAGGKPEKDKDPDASGKSDKNKEPDVSGEPDKDKEPDTNDEPDKDKEPDVSDKPDKDKETKTNEKPIERKDQNQNPDKAGKTTSESSLDSSLNSLANQRTKSAGSTHAFSNRSMIEKQEQLPKKILPEIGAGVLSIFWVVSGGAFLVTSGAIYMRETGK